jgi:hypothetical protein
MVAVNDTDCYVKEFWSAFMMHVCGTQGVPSSPVPTCWVTNFELWNEFNTNGFWVDSATNLAQMGVDAAAIIRKFCADCRISLGSTSGGGAGGNPDTSFTDPNGETGKAYYDTSLAAALDAWFKVAPNAMPDILTWHPYPTYLSFAVSGTTTNVPFDPAPFPETPVSGDGLGNDPGNGTGSSFHTGSIGCPSSITDEYSVDFPSQGSGRKGYCGDSIYSQASKLLAMEKQHHMLRADGVTPKPIWATEGGFGNYADLQGTVTGNNGLTSRDYLRGTYMGRWLLILLAQGVERSYPYSYDDNNDPSVKAGDAHGSECWMVQYYSPATTDCFVTGHDYSNLGGDSWGGTGTTETYTPGTAIGGVAWNNVERWLNGATAPVCTAPAAGGHEWSCTITRSSPTGYHATIYWNDQWNGIDNSFQPSAPSGKHFTQYQYMLSTSPPTTYSGGTVHLAGEPLLFEGIN